MNIPRVFRRYTGIKDCNGVKVRSGDMYTYAEQTNVHVVRNFVRLGDSLRRLGDYNNIPYPYYQAMKVIVK